MNITNLFSIKTGCDETDRQLQKIIFSVGFTIGRIDRSTKKIRF